MTFIVHLHQEKQAACMHFNTKRKPPSECVFYINSNVSTERTWNVSSQELFKELERFPQFDVFCFFHSECDQVNYYADVIKSDNCFHSQMTLSVHLTFAFFCESTLMSWSTWTQNIRFCRCFKMLLVKCSTNHTCSALQASLPKSLNFWKWLPHEEGHSGGEITSFRPWSLGKFLWWKRGCWMIVSSQINSPLLQPVAHVIYTHSCHGNRALWHLPNPLCFISGDCREQSEKSR